MKKTARFKYVIFILLLIIFSLSFFITGVLICQNIENKNIEKKENLISKLQNRVKKLSGELKKEKNNTYEYGNINCSYPLSEIEDYKNATKKKEKNQTEHPVLTVLTKTEKPKLVIILDDVSFAYQIKEIKNIPFKITPSFFPPTKLHTNTPKYAKEFKDYMVHVPMQALNFSHPEPDTINTDWNFNQIKKRIEKIKSWFPDAKFINNHTGSRFTSDLHSMNYLFKVLKEENLGFVDSRTTPYSKALTVEKVYHIPFFKRDVFLDNEQTVPYIQNQLKKAVKIAEKKGYAIAIGHPHKATFKALKTSENILKNVNIITINQLYKTELKNEKN